MAKQTKLDKDIQRIHDALGPVIKQLDAAKVDRRTLVYSVIQIMVAIIVEDLGADEDLMLDKKVDAAIWKLVDDVIEIASGKEG
jgi:hypothetical protein